MQAPGGTRGAAYYSVADLDMDIEIAKELNETLTAVLPDREVGFWIPSAGINLRDQIRRGEDVPLQFAPKRSKSTGNVIASGWRLGLALRLVPLGSQPLQQSQTLISSLSRMEDISCGRGNKQYMAFGSECGPAAAYYVNITTLLLLSLSIELFQFQKEEKAKRSLLCIKVMNRYYMQLLQALNKGMYCRTRIGICTA